MNIIYGDTITADEYNAIRKSMGRRCFHPEQAQADIDGNSLIISARENGTAIAMAGLVWNGGTFAFMNILLNPEYQNRGIEKEFTDRIFNFLRGKLKPGFGIQVEIYVQSGQEETYENSGFNLITPENRGVPMQICLTDQIELTDRMFKQMEYHE